MIRLWLVGLRLGCMCNSLIEEKQMKRLGIWRTLEDVLLKKLDMSINKTSAIQHKRMFYTNTSLFFLALFSVFFPPLLFGGRLVLNLYFSRVLSSSSLKQDGTTFNGITIKPASWHSFSRSFTCEGPSGQNATTAPPLPVNFDAAPTFRATSTIFIFIAPRASSPNMLLHNI